MALIYSYTSAGPVFAGPHQEGRPAILANGNYYSDVAIDPPNGLYEGVAGAVAPGNPAYYLQAQELTFTGLEFDPSGRVNEINTYTRIDLDGLYEIKLSDIGRQDRSVRYNAVDTSLNANWWFLVTESAQAELTIIGIGANQREIRSQSWPQGVNAPWVGIYNAVNGRIKREQITAQSVWDTILLEWNNHGQAVGNATEASRSDLETDYDAAVAALAAAGGDENDPTYQAAWDTVAAHDPADPAWGYPATVNFDGAAAALFGL